MFQQSEHSHVWQLLWRQQGSSLRREHARNRVQRNRTGNGRFWRSIIPGTACPRGPAGPAATSTGARSTPPIMTSPQSTHYPALGAYDSHDPAVIDQHCRWAKMSHIDTLHRELVGPRRLHRPRHAQDPRRLQAARTEGVHLLRDGPASPGPPQTAAQDIIKVLEKYGSHEAHLKVDGKPVVFIYGRAVERTGPARLAGGGQTHQGRLSRRGHHPRRSIQLRRGPRLRRRPHVQHRRLARRLVPRRGGEMGRGTRTAPGSSWPTRRGRSARSPSSPATTTRRSASPAWRSSDSTATSTACSGTRPSRPTRTGS